MCRGKSRQRLGSSQRQPPPLPRQICSASECSAFPRKEVVLQPKRAFTSKETRAGGARASQQTAARFATRQPGARKPRPSLHPQPALEGRCVCVCQALPPKKTRRASRAAPACTVSLKGPFPKGLGARRPACFAGGIRGAGGRARARARAAPACPRRPRAGPAAIPAASPGHPLPPAGLRRGLF